jgi:hypothetical protein
MASRCDKITNGRVELGSQVSSLGLLATGWRHCSVVVQQSNSPASVTELESGGRTVAAAAVGLLIQDLLMIEVSSGLKFETGLTHLESVGDIYLL